MNNCATSPNATIGQSGVTWAQASTHALNTNLTTTAYLRPDTGGALLPWIYTVVLIIIHLPVVIIRVVRWEVVQSWCLVASLFTVIVYTQAYISTQFNSAKVLVWTPIILVIDAGSMLQVFFLVIEARKVRVGNRIVSRDPEGVSNPQEQAAPMTVELEDTSPNLLKSQVTSSLLSRWRKSGIPRAQPSTIVTDLGSSSAASSASNASITQLTGQLEWFRDPATYSAVFAAVLFIAILVLQLIGLAKASQANARATLDPPPASFCSPLFQPFGLAVVDGDCHIYDIELNENQGIGCVLLPGLWQQQWLKGTVAGVSIELVAQCIDILILVMVNGSTKWRRVKMKRPWTTIFSGIVVLVVTLLYGLFYASSLPDALTTRVTVVMDVQGPASYTGTLTSAGLRGTIIGWNDGLFSSWNATYFGTSLG